MIDSIAEWINKRASSAFLISYTIFWCIFHWQGLYVIFFINEDLIIQEHDLLKNEYVNKHFLGIYSHGDIFRHIKFILGIIGPFILACGYIWLLPKFLLLTYEKEVKFKFDKKIMKAKEEARLEKEAAKMLEQKSKNV